MRMEMGTLDLILKLAERLKQRMESPKARFITNLKLCLMRGKGVDHE
nr:MAG TPA: hypothetical protein [Caudoviricetes sp.]